MFKFISLCVIFTFLNVPDFAFYHHLVLILGFNFYLCIFYFFGCYYFASIHYSASMHYIYLVFFIYFYFLCVIANNLTRLEVWAVKIILNCWQNPTLKCLKCCFTQAQTQKHHKKWTFIVITFLLLFHFTVSFKWNEHKAGYASNICLCWHRLLVSTRAPLSLHFCIFFMLPLGNILFLLFQSLVSIVI